mgnify:CR=1 FL=1
MTETLVEEVKTIVPCPMCKQEIEIVLCESIVCLKCGTLVAVHKHVGGDVHLVHGMKPKNTKRKVSAKPKKLKKIPEPEDIEGKPKLCRTSST